MKTKMFTSLVVSATIALGTSTASAMPTLKDMGLTKPQVTKRKTLKREHKKAVKPKKALKPVEYVVKEGDTLTSVADVYKVPLERIWAKNLNLPSPDQLNVGDKLTVPRVDENLPERPLPEVTVVTRPIVSGNDYDPGQCTWYVKSQRPDLPNDLGDAKNWYSSAQAYGIPTGSQPRVGAVGVQFGGEYGHVVYITGVFGDSVTYRDMNGNWIPWELGEGTAPASNYLYIY